LKSHGNNEKTGVRPELTKNGIRHIGTRETVSKGTIPKNKKLPEKGSQTGAKDSKFHEKMGPECQNQKTKKNTDTET